VSDYYRSDSDVDDKNKYKHFQCGQVELKEAVKLDCTGSFLAD